MRVDLVAVLEQREPVEQLDGSSAGAVHRFLERRLEPLAEIEHHVRGANALHVARRELDVVRLGAGRRQVRHLDARAADPLGREGQRVEARDDARPVAVAPLAAPAA